MFQSPKLLVSGDSIFVQWPSDITFELSRFHESRDTLTAEAVIVHPELGMLHAARLNLVSTVSRNSVSKYLEEECPSIPWRGFMEMACRLVIQHLRTGAPAEELHMLEPTADAFLVSPWIPKDEITVLYGPGGSAKSLFGLATLLGGLMGHTLGSPWAVGHIERALYLDWESTEQAHSRRLWRLLHHIEAPPTGRLYHKRLRRPLVDVIQDVRTEAAKLKTDVIVVDSLGAACGPEPETAGAALGALQAAGSLPGTKLIIAHESKAALEHNTGKPFGSIYVENTARSTIEMRPQERPDPQTLLVSVRHAKMNDGPKAPPVSIAFHFANDGTVTLSRAEPSPVSRALADRILEHLSTTEGRRITAISEEMGANIGSLRTIAHRLTKEGKLLYMRPDKREEGLYYRADG